MNAIEGAVLIVGLVCLFGFLIALVVRSDGPQETYRPSTPEPPQYLWSTKYYSPACSSVRVVDDKVIKLCVLDLNHDGSHSFLKTINLDKDSPYDQELS